jgi:uncharacterized membrane protein
MRSKTVEILRKEMNSRESLGEEMNTRPIGRTDLSVVNEKLILNYVRQGGPKPRVSIADNLGLSRATVSLIVSSLIQKGLLKEGASLPSSS